MDKAVEAAFRAIWEREPIRGTGDDGRLAAMARALSAADAARAVPDEEVIETCKAGVRDYWEQAIQRSSQQRSVSDHIAKALRAAGLKVVRDV